jgi:beta-N-acetylhexosaminidase
MIKLICSLSLFSAVLTINAQEFTLTDYYSSNIALGKKVEQIFSKLNDTSIVAQMIMPAAGRLGQPDEKINHYLKNGLIGGVLLLNGTVEGFKQKVTQFNTLNTDARSLPLLYSADAEPSLIGRKIEGSTVYKKASEIKSIEEVRKSAQVIASDLKKIGINYNFAPVVDMSPNKTVGWRSFGQTQDSIVRWSMEFIHETQKEQIIATAKHFPGHGYVSGDTHKQLVYIDGEMREVVNYPYLIENGVLSIMIAHIAVKNNPKFDTKGMPASTSREIVTDLLRDSLGFNGLIVTDAMNMGGVSSVVNANVLAIQAGCDILLMPLDVEKAHSELLTVYQSDKKFKEQVNESVKRIIRMKICLGLL